jgi:hypothetical protein
MDETLLTNMQCDAACGNPNSRKWLKGVKQVAWVAGSLALAAALVTVEVSRCRGQITVSNIDFFGMSARAKLLPGTLSTWVDGFYPIGIPLLLRMGLALGLDVVRTGQIVSVFGGVLCLYGGALFAWHLTRSHAMALLTMAYLFTTGNILFFASFEGTDMLAAGLQVLALGILAGNPRHKRVVLLAGFVNGLGYLVRYTAMVTFVVCLVYLLTMALYRRERRDLWTVPIYGLGFLLGALPQIVPSLLVKGTPFYQTQAYHIWLKLYADSDFVRTVWQTTPIEITLWELFWLDPWRFAGNWWQEFSGFWRTLDVPLVSKPLAQLTKAGFLFAALDARRLDVEHRALLSFFIISVVGILSIFNIDTRFLILVVPAFMVCALYFLWRILPTSLVFGRIRLPVNLLVLVVLLGSLLRIPWNFAHIGEGARRASVIEASNMMHAAGAQAADEVLSTNLYHQDVASPTRDHFKTLFLLGEPQTVVDLRQQALKSGCRFLIYHSSQGLEFYPEYEELLWPENRPLGYTPIWATPAWVEEDRRFAAYRLEPDNPSPQTPTRVSLAGGVSLLGYDLIVSDDQPAGTGSRVGLYLYWQTTEPLTESLKVFVHLLDPQGNLVAQHDSVPATWTYDTRDWRPGEVIVDFHWMMVSPDVESGIYTIAVGLYDEGAGKRWPVLEGPEQPGGDQIILAQTNLGR